MAAHGILPPPFAGPDPLKNLERGEVVHVPAPRHDLSALGPHNVLLQLVDALAARDEQRPEQELLGRAAGLQAGGVVDDLADEVAEVVVVRRHVGAGEALRVEQRRVAEGLAERAEVAHLAAGQEQCREGGHGPDW